MIKVVGPSMVFDYFLNDPTTPNLVAHVSVPKVEQLSPKFMVVGYREGPIISADAVHVQAASVYTTLANTLAWVKKVLKHPFDKWSETEVLIAEPRAGREWNAYYDRYNIKFFFNIHPITKKLVFIADSKEAVDHEFGHAILDAIRPELWNMASLEIFAFHEAFGDIISILSSLNFDTIIHYVLNETGGDLGKSSILSRIAEEFGNALYHHLGAASGRPSDCLRNLVNNFHYSEPHLLPASSPDNVLCQEPHNFSRIFSGAWFQLLVEMFNRFKSQGMEPYAALKKTQEVLANVTLNAVVIAAATPQFFNSVAKAMFLVDRNEYGGIHTDLIRKVFTERKVLNPGGVLMLAHPGIMCMDAMTISNASIWHMKLGKVIRHADNKAMRLGPEVGEIIDTSVVLAAEHQMILDKEDRLMLNARTDEDAAQKAAIDAVNFLRTTDQIALDEKETKQKTWALVDGNLTRVKCFCWR